jgi:uncharacterized membrane protein
MFNLSTALSKLISKAFKLSKPDKFDIIYFLSYLAIVFLIIRYSESSFVGMNYSDYICLGFAVMLDSLAKNMDIQVSKDYNPYIVINIIALLMVTVEPIKMCLEAKALIKIEIISAILFNGVLLFIGFICYHRVIEIGGYMLDKPIQHISFLLCLCFHEAFLVEPISYVEIVGISMIVLVHGYIDYLDGLKAALLEELYEAS